MSEYAVERARQIFQARQARQAGQRQRARTRRSPAAETQTEPSATPAADADAGTLIGIVHLAYSRLRHMDGWLREEHQLNLTEMHVLSLIPEAPSADGAAGRGDAAARLATEVGLSPSGLTRLADRLMKRGLVARVHDVWDKRVTHLVLTEQGRAVRDAVLPRAVEHLRDSCGPDESPLQHLDRIPEDPDRR